MPTIRIEKHALLMAERVAMKERAQELKAQGRSGQKKPDSDEAVLAPIAEMPDADRALTPRRRV